MTKIRKFQGGGQIIDEDELFDDKVIAGETGTGAAGTSTSPLDPPVDTGVPPADPPEAGNLAGATDLGNMGGSGLISNTEGGIEDTSTETSTDPPADPPTSEELSGVEMFLSDYGVNGGIITYEDGSTSRFSDLEAAEQSSILSSLIKDSVPTTEEKYNLDDGEVNLLNAIRESDQSPEEFINGIIDHRLQVLSAKSSLQNVDYAGAEPDAIYVKHLMDSKPEITDDEVAAELVKAQALSTYDDITEGLRQGYINQQNYAAGMEKNKSDKAFNEELEAQRHSVVQTVEEMEDIAGARITPEMKEFLLHDIMELNEDRDPILMENIFSDPKTMFKANWFLHYGEDYINNLNSYWKTQVSKAHKTAYNQAINGMPANPTIISPTGQTGGNKGSSQPVGSGVTFGRVLTEEELFDQENNRE